MFSEKEEYLTFLNKFHKPSKESAPDNEDNKNNIKIPVATANLKKENHTGNVNQVEDNSELAAAANATNTTNSACKTERVYFSDDNINNWASDLDDVFSVGSVSHPPPKRRAKSNNSVVRNMSNNKDMTQNMTQDNWSNFRPQQQTGFNNPNYTPRAANISMNMNGQVSQQHRQTGSHMATNNTNGQMEQYKMDPFLQMNHNNMVSANGIGHRQMPSRSDFYQVHQGPNNAIKSGMNNEFCVGGAITVGARGFTEQQATMAPSLNAPENSEVKKKRKTTGSSASDSFAASGSTQTKSEMCKVCSEPAAKHMHYGAITCFSCKAFFRRAIQNEVWHEFICRTDGNCDINLQSRKHCQKCRYERCLAMGMKPGWVLSKVERQIRFRRRRQSASARANQNNGDLNLESLRLNSNTTPPMHRGGGIFPPHQDEVNVKLEVESQASSPPDGENFSENSFNALMEEEEDEELQQMEVSDSMLPYYKQICEGDGDFKGVLENLVSTYDQNYTSVALGEVLIKEMIMCALFDIPISPASSLAGYRLMIERVTKVAMGMDSFQSVSKPTQAVLLKHNADLLVCLQGSLFFNDGIEGFEQIKLSMGKEDLNKGQEMIEIIMRKHNPRKPIKGDRGGVGGAKKLSKISYSSFNSIQKLDNPELESKFGNLLKRIGMIVTKDPILMKLFGCILLFSTDNIEMTDEQKMQATAKQNELIAMLQRFISYRFKVKNSVQFFSEVLGCVSDLRELNQINMARSFSDEVMTTSEYADSLPIANKQRSASEGDVPTLSSGLKK